MQYMELNLIGCAVGIVAKDQNLGIWFEGDRLTCYLDRLEPGVSTTKAAEGEGLHQEDHVSNKRKDGCKPGHLADQGSTLDHQVWARLVNTHSMPFSRPLSLAR